MSAVDFDNEKGAHKERFLHLLREGVRHKFGVLNRRSDEHAFKKEHSSAMPCLMQAAGTMWHTLAWRDAYSTAPYFIEYVGAKTLKVQQMLQGELNGLGTGFTVWPAACVMIKFLEYRYSSLRKHYVLEIGSGTGAVGLSAALLDAKLVVLSDVSIVKPFLRKNLHICRQTYPDISAEVETYDWSSSADLLLSKYHTVRPNPDIILISDCILPRLYPIEPLVQAISDLSGPNTTIYISYEHRYYEEYNPKSRFWSLMTEKRFQLRALSPEEYNPLYRANDIEIWEVTQMPFNS